MIINFDDISKLIKYQKFPSICYEGKYYYFYSPTLLDIPNIILHLVVDKIL